jgi:hypothetical protein
LDDFAFNVVHQFLGRFITAFGFEQLADRYFKVIVFVAGHALLQVHFQKMSLLIGGGFTI